MSHPLIDVFLAILCFLLVLLLVRVIVDIFRRRDIGSGAKAGWLAFVILLPFLGVFGYLIACGSEMADREGSQAQDYRRLHGETDSRADALAKLADLHHRRAISDADYQRTRDKILGGTSA